MFFNDIKKFFMPNADAETENSDISEEVQVNSDISEEVQVNSDISEVQVKPDISEVQVKPDISEVQLKPDISEEVQVKPNNTNHVSKGNLSSPAKATTLEEKEIPKPLSRSTSLLNIQVSSSELQTPVKSCSEYDMHLTSNTSPKKRVSFADFQGLSLTQIKEFKESKDSLSYCSDLLFVNSDSDSSKVYQAPKRVQKFILLFTPPSVDYNAYMSRLWKAKVCLHSIQVSNDEVTGIVKVINIAYNKEVDLKVTYSGWENFTFIKCFYEASENFSIDDFQFYFYIPTTAKSVRFCIRLRCDGKEYWDNNQEQNYSIELNPLQEDSTSKRN